MKKYPIPDIYIGIKIGKYTIEKGDKLVYMTNLESKVAKIFNILNKVLKKIINKK